MFFQSDRQGSITPAMSVTLGLIIFMFMIGANLFQAYAIRQDMLTMARNIAEFGASQGRFVGNDPGSPDILDSVTATTAMSGYWAEAGFATHICPRCSATTISYIPHPTETTTKYCIAVGATADYLYPELSGSCAGGKYWTVSAPATAVLITTQLPSLIPFWNRSITIRVFATSTVYTDVPAGQQPFPWLH